MVQEDLLYDLLCQKFSGQRVVRQYVIDGSLRLDFYIPELNIACEYQGVQHDHKVDYFHKDNAAFFSSLRRDEKKKYACDQLGINIIYFDYRDELTAELVDQRFLSVGAGGGEIKDPKLVSAKLASKQRQKLLRKEHYKNYKQSEAYREKLQKAKEYRKLRQKH